MQLIRNAELETQSRPDGRTVTKLKNLDLKLASASLQFLYVTHPPRLKEDLHCHESSYEILYFFDRARYKINSKDYELKEKDLVVFEPGDIHGALPVDHTVRLLVIQSPAIIGDKKII